MKTVKIQLDVPGELSLAIDREVLKASSDGKKITKPKMAVKLIKEGLGRADKIENLLITRAGCTPITGDVRNLQPLKTIIYIMQKSDFPEINDVVRYEHTQKELIEINGTLYVNHPNAYEDYVGKYAEEIEFRLFATTKSEEAMVYNHAFEEKLKEWEIKDIKELYEYIKTRLKNNHETLDSQHVQLV